MPTRRARHLRPGIFRGSLTILVAAICTIAVAAVGPAVAESGTYTAAGNGNGNFSESSVSLDTRRGAVAVTASIGPCALLDDGAVKCWGYNGSGQLGQGDRLNRGDQSGEMGNDLALIDLGTGRTATSIGSLHQHTCAVLDNGTVKCWGDNTWGQLGQGDTNDRGDQPGEMGDHLPPIDLGTGRTATSIAVGYFHTCAILDNGTVKCWGPGAVVGQGDPTVRGDQPGEMGDNLPPIDLGTGRTAQMVASGIAHACALLDDGTVKCWGSSPQGELGQGDMSRRGDDPGEMGDNLPPIDLGTGRTATAISAGMAHACALLDDGTVKCWGNNFSGELGQGDGLDRGDDPGEMGDNLPPIDLGIGRTATAISAGNDFTCALIDNGAAKCWGANNSGQLGQGDTFNRGDSTGFTGDLVAPVDLGSGRSATTISAGSVACATLDDGTVKCWGNNSLGQLGQGDTQGRGDDPGEMGDQLRPIDLGTRSVFSGVEPVRVLDTRDGLGVAAGTGPAPVAAGSSITIPVTTATGVPDNAVAVVVNLTTTRSVEAGFLTVHPCNQPVPEASNLNYRPSIDTANLAIAPVSSSGAICVYTSATTDVIVDVTGYTTTGYQPNTPTRLADTRQTSPQAADTTLRVALPSGGGHVVTVTATRATAAGFLTAYDCAQPRPDTSIVNYIPGVDTANLTIATGTELCVYTSAGVDIIVDDHGRIGGTATESQRLIDTRTGDARLAPGSRVTIPASSTDGTSRAVNITATQAAEAGFFTLHPCSTTAPTTSALNYAPGRDIANLAIIPTDTTTCVTTSGTTHLIIDLAATID